MPRLNHMTAWTFFVDWCQKRGLKPLPANPWTVAAYARWCEANHHYQTIVDMVKAIAKELNVPVIALSQLSREVEKRENKRPIMSDLRESGSIEQDADIIIFIYRDAYYRRKEGNPGAEADDNRTEIIVAKHRNGPTGTVHAAFLGASTRFENLSYRNGS